MVSFTPGHATPKENGRLPDAQVGGWASETVWILYEEKNLLSLLGIEKRFLGRSAHVPKTVSYTIKVRGIAPCILKFDAR